MQVCFYSPFGMGCVGNVEVDLRRGIPMVDIVGLSDGSVASARESVRSAVKNSGFDFPPERVLISLSPADLKKEGSGFNLSVALAVLQEDEKLRTGKDFSDGRVLVLGGLSPSGSVERVNGVFAALQQAKEKGIRCAVVPAGSGEKFPEGMEVREVSNLNEAWDAFRSFSAQFEHGLVRQEPEKEREPDSEIRFPPLPLWDESEVSLDDLKDGAYPAFKRAMAVAVAGGHNILMFGSPGCGKTLALQCMPQIMPLLSPEEQVSVNRMYSLAGMGGMKSVQNGARPFRQPHQTASIEGMCGGGTRLVPGEISLAHNGVLFLDEAAEFRTSVLQMLRVPLESHQITLSRAGRSTVFPADFRLAIAASPCPCGNLGNSSRICLCSARAVEQYWKKFSIPLLDRIEVRVDVNRQIDAAKEKKVSDISIGEMRSMIARAQKAQYERQGKLNGALKKEELEAQLSPEVKNWFLGEENRLNLSARGGTSILKIARTLSDMNGEKDVSIDRIKEAFGYHASVALDPEFGHLYPPAREEQRSVSDDEGWDR